MNRIPSRWFFGVGVLCMLIALFEQNITLASGHYGPTLLRALAFAAVADLCLAVPMFRGGLGWRMAAGIAMLPTLFIISDFLRRAPTAFSGLCG